MGGVGEGREGVPVYRRHLGWLGKMLREWVVLDRLEIMLGAGKYLVLLWMSWTFTASKVARQINHRDLRDQICNNWFKSCNTCPLSHHGISLYISYLLSDTALERVAKYEDRLQLRNMKLADT